jgi:hypothetical protein
VLVLPAAATGAGMVASCRHIDTVPDELLIRQYYPRISDCYQVAMDTNFRWYEQCPITAISPAHHPGQADQARRLPVRYR